MQTAPIKLEVPTPVRQLSVEGPGELWLKDDSRISPVYGGNKPRKLALLLEDAIRAGAKRLVTIGALGSHHVLATGLLGRSVGLPTTAIALPRPYSQHAEQTTKETLLAGVELIPLGNPFDLIQIVRRLLRPGDYWIAPGGSNGLGAQGYLLALRELRRQIDDRQLPEPDSIVVALGSGGTAAGILAGIAETGLKSQLIAASVLHLPMARRIVLSLAQAALRKAGQPRLPNLSDRLLIDSSWIGKGYGHPTAAGELAIGYADSLGLSLESTYTAKAFACALAQVKASGHGRRILFWSTFSAVSLAMTADCAVTLPSALEQLLRSPGLARNSPRPQRNA